ncbi:MAG: GldG family protein [Ruminococcus sp.]|nr:GldG family protein [Ruminococcus sp.]MDE6784426.1 GldG family protein [Ruminococcus sp.]
MTKDKEKEIAENQEKNPEKKSEKKEKKPKEKKNLKKLRFGSVSAVVIVLVVAIVVVLNLMCGIMMKRYPVKLDLTPDNRHELSEQSIEALKNIDRDVEITVTTTKDYFDSMSVQYQNMFYQYYGVIVDCPYDIIPEILDKYSVYAESGDGSITVKYIDINKNPDAVSRWSKYYNGDITEGGIVIQCGERIKFISPSEVAGMITPSQNSSQQNISMVFAGESVLTSAVKAVTDANPVRAAVVSSMNGSPIIDQVHSSVASSVRNFLSKNGYDCTEIDIGIDDLSTDVYDMVIVAAPGIDFTADIISKLSDFLYNNGNYQKSMIYIPNFYATNLPNITEFLADWKIQVEKSAVFDDSRMVQASISALGSVTYAPTVNISDSEAVGTLQNESLPIVAPQARPITILSKNNESIVTELISSSDTSYLVSLDEGNEVSEEQSSYSIVVKSRRETASGLDVYGSELLVIGSPFMLDELVLSSTTTYNNANAVLNIVNGMTGKEAGDIIPEKALEQYTLSISTSMARVILAVVVVVIPLLIAAAGVIVLVWRKNK